MRWIAHVDPAVPDRQSPGAVAGVLSVTRAARVARRSGFNGYRCFLAEEHAKADVRRDRGKAVIGAVRVSQIVVCDLRIQRLQPHAGLAKRLVLG